MSSLVHLIAAFVFAILGFYLVRRGKECLGTTVALAVFAFSAVFLLSVSGVYHIYPNETAMRGVMLRLDSVAIFLLIAGTYTPMHAILFKGIGRWGFLTLVWTLAITGITLKTIYFDQVPRWLSLAFYLGLGWLAVFSCTVLVRQRGLVFIESLVLGGVAYSIGGVLNLFRTPTLIPGILGPHELWHLAVLVGLGFHWHFVYSIATGVESTTKEKEQQTTLAFEEY